ncbi:MAG: putative ABC transporter permease [Oscillibacter sp.]
MCYSFLGCLLEKAFARAVRAPHRRRRCCLLLPLCPVYGLGLLAVLALPAAWRSGLWVVLTGAVVTTAVEYAVHWACQRFLGVAFWDYSQTPGNLNGRVCLPFSLAWGGLTALTLWWIHPLLAALTAQIPPLVTYAALLVFTVDAVCSLQFLRVTHDVEALRGPGG